MSYEEIIAGVAEEIGLNRKLVDKIYKSYWNDPSPIEQVLGIPRSLIQLVVG